MPKHMLSPQGVYAPAGLIRRLAAMFYAVSYTHLCGIDEPDGEDRQDQQIFPQRILVEHDTARYDAGRLARPAVSYTHLDVYKRQL